LARQKIYDNIFSAKDLFITGLLIMAAFVFNSSTQLRVIQFLFFITLVLLSGKKVNFFSTFLIIAGIIIFNLIIPYGRVLYSIGDFKITSGALKAGVHRAVTLAGLVMLSRACIRQDLKLTGAFGELLADSLRLFTVMMGKKNHITGKNFITGIDSMLLELSEEETPEPETEAIKTKPVGYAILAAVAVISWGAWLAGFFNLRFMATL
jgi:heptaprenyl diphosphate synthase